MVTGRGRVGVRYQMVGSNSTEVHFISAASKNLSF